MGYYGAFKAEKFQTAVKDGQELVKQKTEKFNLYQFYYSHNNMPKKTVSLKVAKLKKNSLRNAKHGLKKSNIRRICVKSG